MTDTPTSEFGTPPSYLATPDAVDCEANRLDRHRNVQPAADTTDGRLKATTPRTPPAGFGRGAWTVYGMPTQASRGNYVMFDAPQYVGGEAKLSSSHRAVHYGALALQTLIDRLGYRNADGNRMRIDGVLDKGAKRGITWAQDALGDPDPDGVATQATMKRLLAKPCLDAEKAAGVPRGYLFGLVGQESAWDPGAIGYGTPSDHGLVQVNLDAHDDVTIDEAMDPLWALRYGAERMAAAFKRYRNRGASVQLAWDCAIASHNSPARADEWAADGFPPYIEGRAVQIGDYVARVKEFAVAFPSGVPGVTE